MSNEVFLFWMEMQMKRKLEENRMMTIDCPRCGGKGTIIIVGKGTVTCPICLGSGDVEALPPPKGSI